MKKRIVIAGIAAACACLFLGLGVWAFLGNDKADENVVYTNSVETLMNMGSGNGSIHRFAGVVETQQKLEINVSQDKTVKEIYVEEGQEVEVGTPLFLYDTEKDLETLEQEKLNLERLNNTIGNKQNEIAALEKEKKSASSDAKLEYTIQIQSAQMELKQSEYEKKSKQIEIQKLQDSIDNAEVVCEMAGIVQSINTGEQTQYGYYEESSAFMTIIAMGDFRVKGQINEQNIGSIVTGQPVLIHSRVDESVTWKGTMGEVDLQNPGNDSNQYYYVGDSMSQSNSYPFYVELESSEGLMLGQHVYIEVDYGQEEEKAGIWLDASFICDVDTDPYVWADNGKGKLEKRKVVLGQFDENLWQYEIADGLSRDDMITWAEDGLEEGMPTASGEVGQMGQSNPQISEEDMMLEGEMLEGEMLEGEMLEGEMLEGEMLEGEMLEGEMLEDEMLEDGTLEGEMLEDEGMEEGDEL